MASSKKWKEEEKKKTNGIVKETKPTKPTEKKASIKKVDKAKSSKNTSKSKSSSNGTVKETRVLEVPSSSTESVEEEEEQNQKQKSNGKVTANQRAKSGNSRKRSRKERGDDDDEGGEEKEEAKMCRFPMNRIRRIIKSEDPDSQITNEAVFLVNKATEMLIEQFCEEAYECSVQDRKKNLHYKHLSSVVHEERRYEFLSDFVPEKLKAEDALAQRKLAGAGTR